ncbi:MAG: hypothetical protein A2509_07760 [Candidatus Edwardsbacteria bacterium RIFOXYD12_FULL_50_11]|uniref:Uncharacterized protein n=1 Tax=Candidatus Edwardsbacteria bacterium GWF2_54_11 TaxID=1817851 RepID=A0A1F5RFK1_9BACT|nr:MAG: hypothetical protein A2502_12355 [Candidatus Edwardsbacteria bacterium RifOxyC12_full_54_24]OGF06566.1 MAG: hypothetical protein A2273_11800 [Candidatus Edwardsbacteria bacterium RifOxyA12_full_54_48]OGF11731.1 MAG: hypothetical protein A3K15_05295 [Candidatus Edwardsbacteria bacterium GWE2_54_12]OGF13275.1 MAG: hypothetical protein A2024_04600 [Candidatus Edwardsbacteria bacterium GWF2_54_11]OGF17884.1 MAG: hypothetical protein A2509_07760 [Candidatus Edwardsbacteria bacterium RIFOXYD1
MKKLISLIFIALLTIVGCSSVTPAPELIITDVDPPGGGGILTVSFENMNYVDAVLNKRTTTFTDTVGTTPIVESYNIAGYVPGGGVYSYTFTPTYPAMGAGASVQVTFTGTDAYGYNKTFTVTTPKIWY